MLIGIYLYSVFPLRIYRCFLATELAGYDTFRIRDAANSSGAGDVSRRNSGEN